LGFIFFMIIHVHCYFFIHSQKFSSFKKNHNSIHQGYFGCHSFFIEKGNLFFIFFKFIIKIFLFLLIFPIQSVILNIRFINIAHEIIQKFFLLYYINDRNFNLFALVRYIVDDGEAIYYIKDGFTHLCLIETYCFELENTFYLIIVFKLNEF
jgi:hypothetical protein